MTDGENWYALMTAAVRKREIALNGVARWQKKVVEAEDVIKSLSGDRDASEVLPSDAALAQETVSIPSDLRPIFGATEGPLTVSH
jgi:hypothetical protein